MKCLIIAAGRGSRLRESASSKPLFPILGIPLIERVMRSAMDGGITAFTIVTGYKGEHVRGRLDHFSKTEGVEVMHCVNEEWEKGNGGSVLCARDALNEPFLLLMSDHLFDPAIVVGLLSHSLSDGETRLAVDYRVENPLVDMDDVTRVFASEGIIHRIGKGIVPYNAFDTGIFYATPGLFDAIQTSMKSARDASLTGGMRVLAARGKAGAHDIGDLFWMDIDAPRDADFAEQILGSEASEGRG